MAPDPTTSTIETIPGSNPQLLSGETKEVPASPRCKFRVRFRKAGDLRLVSHHDLMHVFERMFRRADLPIPVTQGFNPRPRMWFASALALGVAGLNEVLEIETAELMATDEVQRRLISQCPPGIAILGVRAIDVKAGAHVRRALMRLPLLERIDDLPQRCEAFLLRTECWVERLRPQPRRINIRPFIHELHAHDDRLDMALWITPNGGARPEEIIAALGLKQLLDDGGVIERTDLEVYDELPPGTEGPPIIRPTTQEISANDRHLPEGNPIPSRPTAIMDNPMSFDS